MSHHEFIKTVYGERAKTMYQSDYQKERFVTSWNGARKKHQALNLMTLVEDINH